MHLARCVGLGHVKVTIFVALVVNRSAFCHFDAGLPLSQVLNTGICRNTSPPFEQHFRSLPFSRRMRLTAVCHSHYS